MKKINMILIMTICLFSSFAFSASDSRASIEIESHSTVPADVYPGTTGQLELALKNSGSDTAEAVSVSFSYDGGTQQIGAGDIGAGSSTLLSIPFKVPVGIESGIHLIHLMVYYSDSVGSKSTPLTVSIAVSQRNILQIDTEDMDKTGVARGEEFTLDIKLENTGGVMKNVIISNDASSSFFLKGTNQITLGDLETGGERKVSVTMIPTSSAEVGQQMIPIVFSYEDALHNTVTETHYAGPINVLDSSMQFEIELTPEGTVEIGSQAVFRLTLKNRGGTVESAVVDITPSEMFVPMGSSRIFFDSIKTGESISKILVMGVEPNAAAGYYELSLDVTTGSGYSTGETFGISVEATPEVTVAWEDQIVNGGTIVIQISNTGNSAIRSVYASVESTDQIRVTSSDSKFIGTLNVDDYVTFQPTISILPNAREGTYIMPLTIVYKDGKNQEQTVKQDVMLELSGGMASVTSSNKNMGSITSRKSGGISIFGIDALYIVGVVFLLAVWFLVVPRVKKKFFNKGEKK